MSVSSPQLNELLNQIGPPAQQFLTSSAYPRLIENLIKISPTISQRSTKELSAWYVTLSPEDKKRLLEAIDWVARDLSPYLAEQDLSVPVGLLVEVAVVKVLASLEHADPCSPEVCFIRNQVQQQLTTGSLRNHILLSKLRDVIPGDAFKHFI
jgi:hypothetical protein